MQNFLVAVLAFIALSFTSMVHAQSGNERATAQDVKQEASELLSTLKQYTADQRDEAIKSAEQALTRLDGRIDELENRIDNDWDKMSTAARQKARANLRALRQQRNELAEWFGSFKHSSAGAWEQMKQGFSDAYQAMSDAWEKAAAEYESDSK